MYADVVAENQTTNYNLSLDDIRMFIDFDNCIKILFVSVSIILSLVLKCKTKKFESSTHFSLIFVLFSIVVMIGCVIYIVVAMTLLYFKDIRHIFLISSLVAHMILQFFAPVIPPTITIMTLLYSMSFVFQRTETLKTVFHSNTGSRVIWILSLVYGLWFHPFNSYNKCTLYYITNHVLYPLVSINLVDCSMIFCSTIMVFIKLADVYKHPKHLSNYELANLIHITVVLFFQHMLFFFNLLLINFSESEKIDSLRGVIVEKRGTWQIFGIFVPFSYPYSMLISILFSGANLRTMRSVTFDARRMRRD